MGLIGDPSVGRNGSLHSKPSCQGLCIFGKQDRNPEWRDEEVRGRGFMFVPRSRVGPKTCGLAANGDRGQGSRASLAHASGYTGETARDGGKTGSRRGGRRGCSKR